MQAITTIGLDIAKSVFQVHGVAADGQVVIRRQLKRRYVLAFLEKLRGNAEMASSISHGRVSCQEPTLVRQEKKVMSPSACAQA
jgi:transposase